MMILPLRTIMAEVFECSISDLGEDATINAVSGWDSLNHVKLMIRLTDEGVAISPGDIAELTSYQAIRSFVEVAGGTIRD
jgi:acyl carrier protein